MDVREFSDHFDTLLNSYSVTSMFGEDVSRQEITLNEYEKSVFLTEAQDIVLKRYFYAHENAEGQGFDDSERRQIDFSSLIKNATIQKDNPQVSTFDRRGITFTLPSDSGNQPKVLLILNERLLVGVPNVGTKEYVVKPINYREYDRQMSKPYTQPLKKQAWRLFQNASSGFDLHSEIIPIEGSVPASGATVAYKLRYVSRPDPIILIDLPDGLSICGKNTESGCVLNPILHTDILNEAVRLALASKGVNMKQSSDKDKE